MNSLNEHFLILDRQLKFPVFVSRMHFIWLLVWAMDMWELFVFLHLFLHTYLKILLYDIRSSQPYLTKTHNFGLPITRLEFASNQEVVLSMDGRALKIWNEHNGQPFTSIEPGSDLNDFTHYQNSGFLIFVNSVK